MMQELGSVNFLFTHMRRLLKVYMLLDIPYNNHLVTIKIEQSYDNITKKVCHIRTHCLDLFFILCHIDG